jgi:putative transposase
MLKIKCVCGKFKVNFIYDNNLKYLDKISKNETIKHLSDKDSNEGFLGLDLGLKNMVTGVTYNCEENKSFIIRGTELKQVIRQTNFKLAHLQSQAVLCVNAEITKVSKKDGLIKLYKNSKLMNSLWKYYNDFSENYMHNISRMIIDFCLENCIRKIVVGKNDGWKQESVMSSETNKIFCSIRHAVLIDYLKYKCKDAGIELVVTEESYTSKCDHLVAESMEHHEKYLGKRLKRGLFISSYNNKKINADCNGAIGMLRKENIIRDADCVSLLDRGDIVAPVVVNARGFCLPKQAVRKDFID